MGVFNITWFLKFSWNKHSYVESGIRYSSSCNGKSNRKWHVTFWEVLMSVIKNDLEGHSPLAGLVWCNLSKMCTLFYTFSCDLVLAWSLRISWLVFPFIGHIPYLVFMYFVPKCDCVNCGNLMHSREVEIPYYCFFALACILCRVCSWQYMAFQGIITTQGGPENDTLVLRPT